MGRIYDLKLRCRNCKTEFSKDFPFGKDVLYESNNVQGDCLVCDKNIVDCPNCGSIRINKVSD